MDIVKEQDFKALINDSELPVVVDFYADWCNPCKILGRVLEDLSACYVARVKFVKCDVEEADAITSEYCIRNVPTVLFFNKGVLVDSFSGALPKDKVIEKIEKLL